MKVEIHQVAFYDVRQLGGGVPLHTEVPAILAIGGQLFSSECPVSRDHASKINTAMAQFVEVRRLERDDSL
jgi:hypothetical protein